MYRFIIFYFYKLELFFLLVMIFMAKTINKSYMVFYEFNKKNLVKSNFMSVVYQIQYNIRHSFFNVNIAK